MGTEYGRIESKSASTRRRLSIAVVAAVAGISASGLIAGTTNSTWSATSGSWSNANDWNPTGAPQNNGSNLYDVTISTGTASLDIDPTIQTLNATGGTLTGTATTLTVAGLFTWSGGTLGTSGSTQTLIANGGIDFTAASTFAGGTIDNNATLTWTGGYIYAFGNNAANGNTVFNNNLGDNFNVQCDQPYYGNAIGNPAPDVFNNFGTLTKSTTSGTTNIEAVFNNSGTVKVQTGTLLLGGGGNETGSFTLSSGAGLQVNNSTTFTSASSIGGAGSVTISGGTTTVSGTYDPAAPTTVSGGTVTFQSTNVSLSNILTVSGGTAKFITGTNNIQPSSITLSSGTLTGSDTITTAGLFTWSGGALGTSGSTQTLIANGGIDFTTASTFAGGTIDNNATVAWTGGYIYAFGNNAANGNTVFNNNLGDNFNIQCDQPYYGNAIGNPAPDVFNNSGTLTKSTTSGTTNIEAVFNNSGTVKVQTGTLLLGGGGNETGSFTLSSGAGLQVNNSTTFTSASSIGGAGSVTISGGTTTVSGTYDPAAPTTVSGGTVTFQSTNVSLSNILTVSGGTAKFITGTNNIQPSSITLSSGTLTGSDTITTAGLFTWSGGALGTSGSTQTLIANGGIDFTTASTFAGGTIDNNATVAWTGGYIYAFGNNAANGNTVFNNNLGDNFNVQCDQPYYGNAIGNPAPDVFNNFGTLTKSTTSGTTNIEAVFNNSGTVKVQTGTLLLGGGGNETGSFTLSSGAGLQVNNSTTFTSASSIGGAGSVTISGGTTTVSGTYDPAAPTTVSGGTVTFQSTNVSLSNILTVSGGTAKFITGTNNIQPSSITLSSGTLTGSDTITTAGLFTWSGGTLGTSGSTQTLIANGGIDFTTASTFAGGTIDNNATMTWTGGYIYAFGNNAANGNTVFNNNLGDNFNVQCDQPYYGNAIGNPAPDVFNNFGTLTKSTTSGTTNIEAVFNNSGTVKVQTGTLLLGGGGNETGSFTLSSGAGLQVNNSTTFTSASSIGGAGSVSFAGGTSTVSGTYDPAPTTTVSGGTVTFGSANVSLTGLNITGGKAVLSASSGPQKLSTLSIGSSGMLDITNNHIFVTYTSSDPIASIAAWIKSGYASGAWDGDGIMSTTAQTNAASYGIGYADAADSGNPAGLSAGQIEIMYTLLGDANLDGKVNGADFTILAANFNQTVTDGWDKGDFNYDGSVNGADFTLLANNFNQSATQSAVAAADLTTLDNFAAANGISLASVPEPACAAIMAIAGSAILRRRRRSCS